MERLEQRQLLAVVPIGLQVGAQDEADPLAPIEVRAAVLAAAAPGDNTSQPLASDSFNRVDAPVLGETDGLGHLQGDGQEAARLWTDRVGEFAIEGNRLSPSTVTGSRPYSVATIDVGKSNVEIDAIIRIGEGGQGGVIGRYDPATGGHWRITLRKTATRSQFRIQRFNPTTDRYQTAVSLNTIDTVPIEFGVDYHVNVTFIGTNIVATLNGEAKVSYNFAVEHLSATQYGVGFRVADSELDDFVIRPVPTNIASDSFNETFNRPSGTDLNCTDGNGDPSGRGQDLVLCWTEDVGDFVLGNNRMKSADESEEEPFWVASLDPGVSDVAIEATIKAQEDGTHGLIARYDPVSGDFWYVSFDTESGLFRIQEYHHATESFIVRAERIFEGLALDTDYRIRGEFIGETVIARMIVLGEGDLEDGLEISYPFADFNIGATRVGVRHSVADSEVENLIVSTVGESPGGIVLASTGFESAEGFASGSIDGQAAWVQVVDPDLTPQQIALISQAIISDENPNGGSQHLRIGGNPDLPKDVSVGAISASLAMLPPGGHRISVDVNISRTGGADYDVIAQALSQNNITAQVRFDSNGNILVADDVDGTPGLVDSGFDWTPGQYKTLRLDISGAVGSQEITYYYDGVQIYLASMFGATTVEEIVFKSNNANSALVGDVGDFDNLTITGFGIGSVGLPDLGPAVPAGWDGAIVASVAPNGNLDETITILDEVLVDVAVGNFGLRASGPFDVTLLLDGEVVSTNRVTDPLGLMGETSFEDINLGLLSEGLHTLSIRIDAAGEVVEGNEDNNGLPPGVEISKVIDVVKGDPVGPVDANPFTRAQPLGSLIFLSDGNSGDLQNSADTDDFTFFVLQGQTVSVVVSPVDPAVTLSVELLSGGGVFSSPAAGQPAVIPTRAIGGNGTQTLRISGSDATDYSVTIALNAHIEAGDTSDVARQAIDGSRIDVINVVDVVGVRYGVLGTSDADVDEYTVALTSGSVVDVVLDGLGQNFSGQLVEVLDTDGSTVLASSDSSATNHDLSIRDWEVTADGVYTIRVTSSLLDARYGLVLTDGLVFDSEPNGDLGGLLRNLGNGQTVGAIGYLQAREVNNSRLFAVDQSNSKVIEIDPNSGAVINSFDLPAEVLLNASGLAFDGHSLFFASAEEGQRTLFELNPDTGAIIDSDTFASIGLSDDVAGLGIYGGRVVGIDDATTEVFFVSPGADKVVGSWLPTSESSASLILGNGITGAGERGSLFTWGYNSDFEGVIFELNAADGAVLNTLTAPGSGVVTGAAFVDGALFVSDHNGLVFRLDPDSGQTLDSFSLGTSISALGGDDGLGLPPIFNGPLDGPQVLSVRPSEFTGTDVTEIEIVFSESIAQGPAETIGNYQLNGGEVTINSATLSGGNTVTLQINGGNPLADGDYTLTIDDNLVDASDGHPLNSTDGATGANEVHTFSVGDFVPGGDIYEIFLNVGDPLTVSTRTPFDAATGTPGNDLDPRIVIFDGNNNFVAADSNSAADGRNASLTIEAATAGIYKVQVIAESGSGDYVLSLTGGETPGGPCDDAAAADLTCNGFVDFDDVAVLLAHWNTDVGASLGNIVDREGSLVDSDDLMALLAVWTGPDLGEEPVCAGAADLTCDGFVDFDDMAILLSHWNEPASAGQGNIVDPAGSVVDRDDLLALLAAWTGPDPDPGAALAAFASASPQREPGVLAAEDRTEHSNLGSSARRRAVDSVFQSIGASRTSQRHMPITARSERTLARRRLSGHRIELADTPLESDDALLARRESRFARRSRR